jgi:hypothetical protein
VGRQLRRIVKGRKDVDDFGPARPPDAENRDLLLVAVDQRSEAIADPATDQRLTQGRIGWDRNNFPFLWKVMISRSGDEDRLFPAGEFDFGHGS